MWIDCTDFGYYPHIWDIIVIYYFGDISLSEYNIAIYDVVMLRLAERFDTLQKETERRGNVSLNIILYLRKKKMKGWLLNLLSTNRLKFFLFILRHALPFYGQGCFCFLMNDSKRAEYAIVLSYPVWQRSKDRSWSFGLRSRKWSKGFTTIERSKHRLWLYTNIERRLKYYKDWL